MAMKLAKRGQEVVRLVAAADGELLTMTRLQKTMFFLQETGITENRFEFRYLPFGPYSDILEGTIEVADELCDNFKAEVVSKDDGVIYDRFTTTGVDYDGKPDDIYRQLVQICKHAGRTDMEIAGIAAYLKGGKMGDPWGRAGYYSDVPAGKGLVDRARALYLRIASLQLPKPLPELVC